MSLNVKAFGLAGGIIWGLALFIFTLISVATGYWTEFLNIFTIIYPYYNISYLGSVIGLIWGFIDAFICFAIFAWLYNKLERR